MTRDDAARERAAEVIASADAAIALPRADAEGQRRADTAIAEAVRPATTIESPAAFPAGNQPAAGGAHLAAGAYVSRATLDVHFEGVARAFKMYVAHTQAALDRRDLRIADLERRLASIEGGKGKMIKKRKDNA